MPSFSDVYAAVKLDLDAAEEVKLKRRIEKIDTKTAGNKMGMGLSKNLGGGFRAGIGGAARTMFAPIVAAAAAVGTFQLFKGFIEDAQEAAKISRITAQVIETTGEAANVTAKQVDELSQSLSNKTAVDDELVQTGANLLLTFKNVRNEVGEGNDIFNRATEAALDLSAAGFGSVESSAKMLGKALNDPIAGLTALKKAGVTFTDAQREQIKTLVESGDILAAQGIIMDEVASQVGGAAEAAAGPMDKLKTIMGNLGEEIGTALLPHLEDFAEWMIAEGVPKIQRMIEVFRDEWIPVIQDLVKSFVEDWWPAIQEVWGFVVDVFQTAWPIIEEIYRLINTAGDRWGERFQAVKDLIDDIWDGIKNAWAEGVRVVANFMIEFAEVILDGAEAAFGWVPGIGDKLRDAQGALEQFKEDVNRTLDGIGDEEVVIKITAAGLTRVATQSAAAAAARFQGGAGGFSGGSSLRPFTTADAVGGSLGLRTAGLSADRIGHLASQVGDRAGDVAFAELRRLFKSGAFFGPGGAGIPGRGRLFPLPPGTYRRSQGPHDGGAIDWAAPYGTPVRASFSGFLDVGDLGGRSYGKFYRLFGPGQRSILGAHLSSFARGDGPISRGQLIGRVGSTGNSTGNHLHLLGFDQGGWLPPGPSLVVNNTGKPEKVTPADQPIRLHPKDIRALGEVMGQVVLRGVSGASHSMSQTSNLYARGG